ncbi:arabinofuranosyltransferase [Tomitella cavernea]|uniref:arabinofuranosyltransferase n=1 Tax=Tomitella cavernea TaxID=1387982 RepID=UPI00190812B5|nr:arabinofuranosyltransferase [Tomitella cavernea]
MPSTHTPRAPVYPGTGLGRSVVAQIVGAAIVAAAVSIGYQAAYRRLRFPMPSEVPTVVASLVTLAVTACLAGTVLLCSRHRCRRRPHRGSGRLIVAAGWVLPALLSTAIQSWLLTGTKFYLNGLGGDQQFRTAFLTRMTDSPALADAVYPDLPPYYSPAWFWVGGRLADATGIHAWEFYKIWSIVTLAVAAALAHVLWARVVRPSTALILAMVTALVGLHTAAYSPYSWILVALAPPLAVLALRTARRLLRDGRLDAGACAGIGVYVGLAAITHALIAGVAAVFLAAVVATVALQARARTHLRRFLRGAAIAVASALPFVAVVWVPYLLASSPLEPDSTAAKFLPEIGARIPTPVFYATPLGALCAVGLGWLVVRARRDVVATGLTLAVGTALLWYALSFLAPLVSTTLLAFRLEPLLILALSCAGVLGIRDAAALARRRVRDPSRRAQAAERARVVTALVGAFAVASMLHVSYQTRTVEPAWNRAALNTPGPDGVIAEGTELQRTAGGPSAEEIHDAISALSGGRKASDLVALTDDHSLLAFYPYRGFQTVTSAYANPKAGFADRNGLIRDWAKAGDGLAAALDASPVRAPDVFVLSRTPQGWVYSLSVSRLPREPGDVSEPAVFSPSAFDPAHFAVQEVGHLVVAVRR